MIPSTAEHLREYVGGWPVAEIRAAVAAGMPSPDAGTVALLANWPASELSTSAPATAKFSGVECMLCAPAAGRFCVAANPTTGRLVKTLPAGHRARRRRDRGWTAAPA